MVNASQSSASGLISLLSDPDPSIVGYAIEQLNAVVPSLWAEISEVVADIEALSESASPLPAPHRQLCSLLTSKIYFYLGAMDEAVDAALGAEDVFENDPAWVESKEEGSSEGIGAQGSGRLEEYRESIVSFALDRAITLRSSIPSQTLDPKLAAIVERVLESGRLTEGGKITIGLTLSLQRLDLLEKTYLASETGAAGEEQYDEDLLRYVLGEVVTGESGNQGWTEEFRQELLQLLLRLFNLSATPDFTSITLLYLQLDSAQLASASLSKMLQEGKALEAYQVAFDLVDAGSQGFLAEVLQGLQGPEGEEGAVMTTNMKGILSGEKSIRLYLEFLSKNNKADLGILRNTKEALEARHSIFHNAVSFANAFANAGTTSDVFLRENLEWLGRSSNWSRFSATAALGVIHKGSLAKAMTVLGPYLPSESGQQAAGSTVYSEGGSLYALGLIHAKHGRGVLEFLKSKLRGTVDEVVQHGAALGLGVAALASHDEDAYEELRNVLFQDSSVAGEASGYAMGLVMLGSGSEKATEEMMQYAHETQHEKIIRGLAIGIAFLYYGKAEAAESIIDQLVAEKDSILRYGGMYTIALAYAGTANNKAIRRLLNVAVSDVNDDVRRAAVTCLGFVMFRNHAQVPRVVQLLSQSYNPHVRHGATLALGISCAGTASVEACDLLEPMTRDPVDFVRQGAFISLAMILIQQSDQQSAKVEKTRKLFEKVISDKHEDSLAKFGAALGQGIIDAGGRNVTLSMQSKAGMPDMTSIVGMTLFCQFWYWYPLAHGLSLSFSPTAIIGLDVDLKLPKFDITSNAKPSLFAYPEMWKAPVKEKAEKVATAVLSTTTKAKARAKAREKEKAEAEGDAMDTDDKAEVAKADDKTDEEKTAETAPKKKEPTSETLGNLVRVTPAQLSHISFPSESRYTPVRPISRPQGVAAGKKGKRPAKFGVDSLAGGGIVLLKDSKPGEESEFIELTPDLDAPPPPAPAAPAAAADPAAAMLVDEDGSEADMPAPFEYPFGADGQ